MFDEITVIGAGRAGTTIAARLRERGVRLGEKGELRLLCVPDRAIAEVARSIPPGPWVAHVSGATPLAALDPHARRFSVHPLQTLSRDGGPQQLDGAFGGVTAEPGEARARGLWLAETLGLQPFILADDRRALYHAGASIASNFLVTLEAAAERLATEAGGDRELLLPLVRATVENWAALGAEGALTGPVARGDEATVAAQRAAIAERATDLLGLFDALVDATRTIAKQREAVSA
jgi:predicted short-subunit dehydrogenase-like oxidoreductase (DUF2520 family)